VINCPSPPFLPASFHSAQAARAAPRHGAHRHRYDWPGLPDNCVVLDLPRVPQRRPNFALKKGCRLGGVQDGKRSNRACTVYITQSSPARRSADADLLTNCSRHIGQPCDAYMLNIGKAPPPCRTGGVCPAASPIPMAQVHDCRRDFNSIEPSDRCLILSIRDERLWRRGFSRTARSVRNRDAGRRIGRTGCRDSKSAGRTILDVRNSGQETGPATNLHVLRLVPAYHAPSRRRQWRHPSRGPLVAFRSLSFGAEPVRGSILNITSADPWSCSNPPMRPAGQAHAEMQHRWRAIFLLRVSSFLTVDLNELSGAMDHIRRGECVSIGPGQRGRRGEPARQRLL